MSTPQQAPVHTSMAGKKLFTTSNTPGGDEGNIDPLNLPIPTAVQQALDAIQTAVPSNAAFHWEGDSITIGPGGSSGQTEQPWRIACQTLSNFANRGAFTVSAVSGSTLANMQARYASQVQPLAPSNGETKYLLGMIGINDAASGALTATNYATWFASLESYWTTAKADGWKIVWLTPTPRNSSEYAIRKVSDLIMKSTIPDVVVDANQIVSGPGSNGTPDYYVADNLHLTEEGGVAIAKQVNLLIGSEALGLIPALRKVNGVLYGEDKLALDGHNGRIRLGDNSQSSGAAIDMIGNARMTGAVITYSQKNAFHFGLNPSANSMALATAAYDVTLAPISSKSFNIGVGVDENETQTVRWKFGNNGILRGSKYSSRTSYTQNDTWHFGIIPAANQVVLNSQADDLALVAPSGQDIVFGTAAPATTQSVILVIPSGGIQDLADNAAAAAAGLRNGEIYRTGDTLKIKH